MLHAAVMKEIGIMAKIGTTFFSALMGRSLTTLAKFYTFN